MLKRIIFIIKATYFLNHFPNVFTLMFSNRKKLIYYGFLGDGNFGDEMVFMATKKLFNDSLIIPFQRHMPLMIKLYCKLYIDSIDGVIVGGGTLIGRFNADKGYYEKLISLGKPVFLHGTGVDEQLKNRTFWLSFFKNSFHGGLRGPQSQFTIRNTGFNCKQMGDAGLYLNGIEHTMQKKKLIIVNFGTHEVVQDLGYSRSQIIEFLNSEILVNYKIMYLPMHSIDYDIGKSLQSEINGLEVLSIADNYQSSLKLMSEAEFCIGERLHFVVMSVLANTNFMSINYHPKHEDFLKSLDLESFGYHPKSVDSKVVERIFIEQGDVVDWSEINVKIKELKRVHESEKNSFLSILKNYN